MIKKTARAQAALLLCVAAGLLAGCQVHISIGTKDNLAGESYPDAEKYQTGAFTYPADAVEAVEVYWRSGEVEIKESDNAELGAKESGNELPEDSAMHYFLDDGVLRIRFCASGAKIQVNALDKHLQLEIPRGINLSVHTTAALTKADTLNQQEVLIAALSGDTALGTVTADTIDLSSSSGSICADSISARSLKCRASSGDVTMGSMISETSAITTSSGNVQLSLADVSSAEIHTSSGDVDLTIAKDGAEVLHATSSGKLLTDRAYDRKGDLYVFSEGASAVTVETSSGNLRIQ